MQRLAGRFKARRRHRGRPGSPRISEYEATNQAQRVILARQLQCLARIGAGIGDTTRDGGWCRRSECTQKPMHPDR